MKNEKEFLEDILLLLEKTREKHISVLPNLIINIKFFIQGRIETLED